MAFNDPKLRDTMIEFLNHYRDFHQKTNIILDAMGLENILFLKTKLVIGSLKWETQSNMILQLTNALLFNSIQSGIEVNLTKFFNFTHAYYSPAKIRAVNVCAMKLGLEPVINDVAIDSKSLFILSQKLSIPERMLAYAQIGSNFQTIYLFNFSLRVSSNDVLQFLL